MTRTALALALVLAGCGGGPAAPRPAACGAGVGARVSDSSVLRDHASGRGDPARRLARVRCAVEGRRRPAGAGGQ